MKFKLGGHSEKVLATVKEPLQKVIRGALELGIMDLTVMCGVRSKAEQDRLFGLGKSKLKWPNSKHNAPAGLLASAVDVAPYVNNKLTFNYNDCCHLAGIILAYGKSIGVELRWGGNWDGDGEILSDQTFQDLVHFELKG